MGEEWGCRGLERKRGSCSSPAPADWRSFCGPACVSTCGRTTQTRQLVTRDNPHQRSPSPTRGGTFDLKKEMAGEDMG